MKKSSRYPVDNDAIMDKLVATAKSYGVKGMACDINKRYITLSNELREAEYAKLGFRTALDILQLALRPDAEEDARIAARKVVEMACEKLGFVAYQVPEISGTCSDSMNMMARVSKEYAEHIESVAAALQDGKWSLAEVAECRRENRDLLRACLEADAHFEQLEQTLES